MNIFVLDRDIRACARYHMDRHVVKMILESAQMLCTVLHLQGLEAPYAPTHSRHPCTLWAGATLANWRWLRRLALALNDEFRYRFERDEDHASAVVARDLPAPPLPRRKRTPFAQAVPEGYRVEGDAVAAYRRFYVGEKSHLASWTRRRAPKWFRRAQGRGM
jgi:hypothetical protein